MVGPDTEDTSARYEELRGNNGFSIWLRAVRNGRFPNREREHTERGKGLQMQQGSKSVPTAFDGQRGVEVVQERKEGVTLQSRANASREHEKRSLLSSVRKDKFSFSFAKADEVMQVDKY